MTKGRKTTFEERIQIVDHCLKQQKNYQATSETVRGFIPTGVPMGKEI